MEKVTDWLLLWRQLVEMHAAKGIMKKYADEGGNQDAWYQRARQYHAKVMERWQQPDSSRDHIVAQLKSNPGSTLLDIGAGTGSWTCLTARYAKHVTAVEPSPAMAEVLQENLAQESLTNVNVAPGSWPDVEVEPHDFTLCSHAMYGYADFAGFVERMVAVTRKSCFMLLRVPVPDGVMAQACRHIWRQPYDSANFQVAYNALLQMGIYPHVQMEDTGLWRPWTHETLEEALADVKWRLCLDGNLEYDAYLSELLQEKLTYQNGQYIWPSGVRSALVSWYV
ncbi:MAG: methyltransferase domain-containing protein [Anaerolineae bacterium]|nr:methyltransferase domain-containing protein [Anaerolineae bacterium]